MKSIKIISFILIGLVASINCDLKYSNNRILMKMTGDKDNKKQLAASNNQGTTQTSSEDSSASQDPSKWNDDSNTSKDVKEFDDNTSKDASEWKNDFDDNTSKDASEWKNDFDDNTSKHASDFHDTTVKGGLDDTLNDASDFDDTTVKYDLDNTLNDASDFDDTTVKVGLDDTLNDASDWEDDDNGEDASDWKEENTIINPVIQEKRTNDNRILTLKRTSQISSNDEEKKDFRKQEETRDDLKVETKENKLVEKENQKKKKKTKKQLATEVKSDPSVQAENHKSTIHTSTSNSTDSKFYINASISIPVLPITPSITHSITQSILETPNPTTTTDSSTSIPHLSTNTPITPTTTNASTPVTTSIAPIDPSSISHSTIIETPPSTTTTTISSTTSNSNPEVTISSSSSSLLLPVTTTYKKSIAISKFCEDCFKVFPQCIPGFEFSSFLEVNCNNHIPIFKTKSGSSYSVETTLYEAYTYNYNYYNWNRYYLYVNEISVNSFEYIVYWNWERAIRWNYESHKMSSKDTKGIEISWNMHQQSLIYQDYNFKILLPAFSYDNKNGYLITTDSNGKEIIYDKTGKRIEIQYSYKSSEIITIAPPVAQDLDGSLIVLGDNGSPVRVFYPDFTISPPIGKDRENNTITFDLNGNLLIYNQNWKRLENAKFRNTEFDFRFNFWNQEKYWKARRWSWNEENIETFDKYEERITYNAKINQVEYHGKSFQCLTPPIARDAKGNLITYNVISETSVERIVHDINGNLVQNYINEGNLDIVSTPVAITKNGLEIVFDDDVQPILYEKYQQKRLSKLETEKLMQQLD